MNSKRGTLEILEDIAVEVLREFFKPTTEKIQKIARSIKDRDFITLSEEIYKHLPDDLKREIEKYLEELLIRLKQTRRERIKSMLIVYCNNKKDEL